MRTTAPTSSLFTFCGRTFSADEIGMMRRIAAGAKPNWNALTINALAIYVAVAYLLTFAFWTR